MVNQIQHIYCSYKFRKMNRGTNKIEESLLFHSLIVVSEWKFSKMDNLKNEAASESSSQFLWSWQWHWWSRGNKTPCDRYTKFNLRAPITNDNSCGAVRKELKTMTTITKAWILSLLFLIDQHLSPLLKSLTVLLCNLYTCCYHCLQSTQRRQQEAPGTSEPFLRFNICSMIFFSLNRGPDVL